MKVLSLLIPVYNEENNIIQVLQNTTQVSWNRPVELVLVDDCSSDNSLELIKQWKNKNEGLLSEKKITVQVFQNSENSGKGASLHKAIAEASGDVLIVQDADFEYDIQEVPKLVEPIFEGRADIVYGSRFKKNSPNVHRTFHYFVNRFLTFMSNLCSGIYVTDMETCYKAFDSQILKNISLKSRRFGFEPEVTAHLARLKVKVLEFPISYYPRSYLEGKKISWKDGIAALWHILRCNLLIAKKNRFKPGLPEKFVLRKSDSNTWRSGSKPSPSPNPSHQENLEPNLGHSTHNKSTP